MPLVFMFLLAGPKLRPRQFNTKKKVCCRSNSRMSQSVAACSGLAQQRGRKNSARPCMYCKRRKTCTPAAKEKPADRIPLGSALSSMKPNTTVVVRPNNASESEAFCSLFVCARHKLIYSDEASPVSVDGRRGKYGTELLHWLLVLNYRNS